MKLLSGLRHFGEVNQLFQVVQERSSEPPKSRSLSQMTEIFALLADPEMRQPFGKTLCLYLSFLSNTNNISGSFELHGNGKSLCPSQEDSASFDSPDFKHLGSPEVLQLRKVLRAPLPDQKAFLKREKPSIFVDCGLGFLEPKQLAIIPFPFSE
jgi:hypothetical protein